MSISVMMNDVEAQQNFDDFFEEVFTELEDKVDHSALVWSTLKEFAPSLFSLIALYSVKTWISMMHHKTLIFHTWLKEKKITVDIQVLK